MKKKSIVIQEEISDCGACCLLSIIRHYKADASLESIRYLTNTSSNGVNAYNLIECAKQYGFDAIGIRKEDIEKTDVPCIAHLNINKSLSHFVVIYEINDEYLVLMDPAKGKVKIKRSDFYQKYSGNIIRIIPKNILIPRQKNLFYKKIKNLFHVNLSNILLIIVLNAIFIILSIIYSFYINIFNEFHDKILIISLFFFIAIIKILVSYCISHTLEKIDYRITTYLIPDFFSHIFHLPLNYIHMKSTGEVLKRVEDVEIIKNIFTKVVITLVLNVIIIISLFIVISAIDIMIFTIMVLIFLAFILLSALINRNINNDVNDLISASTNYNSTIVDSLRGITSIYHSDTKQFFKEKISSSLKDYLDITKKVNIKFLRKSSIKDGFIILFELLINTILILKVNDNTLAIEYIVIINMLLGLFISSLNEIYNIIPNISYQKNIIRRINEFYDMEEEDNEVTAIENTNIKFKNVSFSYNTIINVLTDKNMVIKTGDKIILKGISGSGKSTICRLLNKEYNNYTGNIFIGGNELKSISTNTLRNIISYASQTERIFSGTIKDNITLGVAVPDAVLNKVISICRLNKIFSNKVFKLDTFLYSGGEDLSGGERQLVILARTLIRNKNIIILDEILSEVNFSLEQEIVEDIFKYYKNKTIIYISHKNININGARNIYV